jgi:hypothetical protein
VPVVLALFDLPFIICARPDDLVASHTIMKGADRSRSHADLVVIPFLLDRAETHLRQRVGLDGLCSFLVGLRYRQSYCKVEESERKSEVIGCQFRSKGKVMNC